MSRPCDRSDADLLMLLHGELDRRAALRLRAHLATCPACRSRARRLSDLTTSLAASLRNPSLGVRTFRRPPRFGWASTGALTVAVSAVAWMAYRGTTAPSAPLVPAAAPPVADSNLSCHRSDAPTPKTKAAPKPKHAEGDVWIEDAAGRPHLVPKETVEPK